MRSFTEFSLEEQEKAGKNAAAWKLAHATHVETLVNSRDRTSYPPSGSDVFRPELWKAAHWRWFIDY